MDDPVNGVVIAAVKCSLDDFPDDLILHIFSFLPTITAVKTSVLSRRYRYIWSSIPSLSFRYEFESNRQSFINAVNRTLILRQPDSPSLHSFSLQFVFKEYIHSSIIESWIIYAVNRDVLVLDLDFYIDHTYHSCSNDRQEMEEEPYFVFSFYSLLRGKIRVLKLMYCDINLPFNNRVTFDSILSVFFDSVHLNDEMASELMRCCPNLESLGLENCWGLEKVTIRGLKMKKLMLSCCICEGESDGWILIDFPNLVVLDIFLYAVEKYTLRNPSSLVEASVYFAHTPECYELWSKVVSLLGHVKKLNVQNWWFEMLMVPKDTTSLKFSNLVWLQLKTLYTKSELLGIAALLELCPYLETLITSYLYKLTKEEENLSDEMLNKSIRLNLPRLKLAKLNDYTGSENEILFLQMLLKHAPVWEKLVVTPNENADGDAFPPIVVRRTPDGSSIGESQVNNYLKTWEVLEQMYPRKTWDSEATS